MIRPFLFFLLSIVSLKIMSQSSSRAFEWAYLPSLPDAVGFAGAYSGVSNGALIVAGGANFPHNAGPWGKAPKTWYDDIYVLESPTSTWKKAGKLPQAMGYGLSITTPNGVFCVGGANAKQHFKEAFYIEWKHGQLHLTPLPPLPAPLAYASGALIDNKVYVAGGTHAPSDTITTQQFWEFDLQKKQWNALPSLPNHGRMLAVAGAQKGTFFLFSGVKLSNNPVTSQPTRTYLNDAWHFEPKTRQWKSLASLPHAVAAAPSPAFSGPNSELMIFGGDDGVNAHRVLELKEQHPGFRKEVLAYHTNTNTWRIVDTIPSADSNPKSEAAVTTPLVIWHHKVVIPTGEISPGIRSPQIKVGVPLSK